MANDIMKRLGLWAIGTVLPKEQVFERHVRHMAKGVTFLVCGGMIVASVFLALLGSVYLALLQQGLSVAASAAITIIIALLGAAVCFLLAERSLSRASKLTDELKIASPALPRVEADVDLQEGASVLINAFLDGFRGPRHYRERQIDLFEELARKEAELAELEMRHHHAHVEREYDGDKDIIRFRPRHERQNETG